MARKFSVIIPVYFNEESLPGTLERLGAVLDKLKNYDSEIVFVEDGSGDKSLELLLRRQKSDRRIKIVKLTRNFGSMAAIQAGFMHAGGDCVGMISADLQDPPELFLDMIAHWEKGIKTVFAVRKDRKDPLASKFFSNTYYALLRRFGVRGYPPGGFDFFLLDRQVVNELNAIHEKNTHIMPLIFWLGYEHVLLPYVRQKRQKGTSRWTWNKKIKLFMDSFIAFSYVPIRAVFVLGMLFAVISFFAGLLILVSWISGGQPVEGWAMVMTFVAFFGGVQMIFTGIIGEYLWRTLDASRKRPQYVVDRVYNP